MYKNSLPILAIFFINFFSFSQSAIPPEVYSEFDKNSGIENSLLFRGIEYVETDRMINEKHKFFKTKMFEKGTLSYNGETFYDVPLKYNIYNDLLLVNLQQGTRNFIFQLISDKVNNFIIDNHQFRYLRAINKTEITGFYEILNEEGDFKIYKKHLQNSREIRDKNVSYMEFISEDSKYVYQFNKEFFELNNRSELIKNFPVYKNEIKNFYKENREQFRKNPDVFMASLAREMNLLILSYSNKI